MNNNYQTIKAIFFSSIFSFALISSISFAKDTRNFISGNKKNFSDTTITSSKTQQLKYALLNYNARNFNSFYFSELPDETQNKLNGFPLDDGTIWLYQSEINSFKLGGMAAVVLAIDVIGYHRLKELWYDWETSKLHGINLKVDFNKYRWMDKYGHLMHAYFASELFSKGYRWSGMSGENSILYGSLSGWLWMLQIEIADGFFEKWGFSWGDLIFNTLGAGFSALQQIYPEELGGIQPKISYKVSTAYKEKQYYHEAKSNIDDYEGMTFWLAVNAYHYSPEKIQNNYPEWAKPLGLALGYSAKGIGANPQGGYKEIFIGLDYDFRKLSLGDESSLIRFLKSELNILRLPLPAVRISPHGVWYGLYF